MPNPDTIRLILTVMSFVSLLGMAIRPFYGVLSYLIIMMARPGSFYPQLGEMRIELIVGLLVILVMILSPSRMQRLLKLPSDLISKRMLILFGVMIVSMIQAFDFGTSWDWMIEFSKVFMFFLMIVVLVDNERDVNIFLWVFVTLTWLMAYDAIYNFSHGIIKGDLRAFEGLEFSLTSGGMGRGHVALANMILQGMPFAWYLSVNGRGKLMKVLGLFMFFIMAYGIIVSGSRGGFVGLITLGICIVFFSKRKILTLAGVIVSILVFPMFTSSGYMEYMETMLNLGTESGQVGSDRWTGLINGLEMMIRRPILGVGPGCYSVARKAWFHWGLWAHNHLGELMGDLGIIGLWAWFSFLITYLRSAIKLRRIETNPISSAILTGVIVSTVLRLVLGMGTHSVYIFFWYMIAGIVVVLKRIDSKTPQKSAQA